MNNLQVEGIVSALMGAVGTIIMTWSIFVERAGLTAIGFIGLLIFGVGILLGIDILLTFYSKMRKMKIDWSKSDSALEPTDEKQQGEETDKEVTVPWLPIAFKFQDCIFPFFLWPSV